MPSLSEDENGIDGGVVYYVDNEGVFWSSGLSPATQNSSAFEITEYVDLDLPIASKVVKAKFNCTLYDGNGNSKTIRNGEARAMIFSCN
nr:hypothetical protein [uncultured Draconibacterium sp.]